MNTINRYILYELGFTFLIGLIGFTGLLIIVGLVQEALENHVPLTHVIRLVPYVIVEMSRISLPVTLLLSVTTFFARMSGNNEVIALKSLGIPPWRFLAPVMFLSILVSIVAFEVNEMAVTWGQPGISMVIYHGAEDILLEQLKREHRFETADKNAMIMVKGVDNRKLIAPTIMLKKEGITVEAQSADIEIDFRAELLKVSLTGLKMSGENQLRFTGQTRTIEVPLSEIVHIGNDSNRPANMGTERITKEIGIMKERTSRECRIIAAHRTFGASLGSVDAWVKQPINDAKTNIRSFESAQNRLKVETPRRWATGFSCFFFVWLGAPLAIWMRKSDFFSSFFACFIPILIFYYPLMMFGLSEAKNGTLPAGVVWVANLAIGIAGIWFIRRIHRY